MNKNIRFRNISLIFFVIILFLSNIFIAQSNNYSSSEIQQKLKKLNVLGSVLYIAAHPDDENQSVLTYMSKERLLRTGYLSLTRGDGGQNLLGSEKGDLLGVIRTQELLAARKQDGAQQFFTRAVDFGFSKSAEESLNFWGHDKILSDVVKVIREFRPDVIITRFTPTRGGHGHHLSSAILAEEAFAAAADPTKFPEQLKTLNVWQVKRLVWDSFTPTVNAISIDVGKYNKVLGKSYTEIAAAGRSMHKTQGFGSASGRGSQLVQFEHTLGDTAKKDIFDGIDLTWNRYKRENDFNDLVNTIITKFDSENPDKSVSDLVKLYKILNDDSNNFWAKIKKREIADLIKLCSGLWLESISWEPGISRDKDIDIRSQLVNRSNLQIKLKGVKYSYHNGIVKYDENLEFNNQFSIKQNIKIPINAKYTQPYWLEKEKDGAIFKVSDLNKIGLPVNGSSITTIFILEIENQIIEYSVPVEYRWVDAVKGELLKPFVVRPEISIKISEPLFLFNGGKEHFAEIQIESKEKNLKGEILVNTPTGWVVEPKNIPFELVDIGDKKVIKIKVSSTESSQSGYLDVVAKIGNKEFDSEIIEIDYSHIPMQTVLQKAKSKLVKLNVKIENRKIGYIMGSGDDIPQALEQLGYEIKLLEDDEIERGNLDNYDVIICGIRAFNTRDNLGRLQKYLIEYTERGGTWIVQHNTRFGEQVAQKGPYPFTASGRDRVAEENAEVQILMPDHKTMNYPNKIVEKDFDNWVQERGTYFAENWGGKLYPILATNDKGEPSKMGGLLYANYGNGVFIYTAYSWFRQIPAGVEGAYKIFANLISSKGKE